MSERDDARRLAEWLTEVLRRDPSDENAAFLLRIARRDPFVVSDTDRERLQGLLAPPRPGVRVILRDAIERLLAWGAPPRAPALDGEPPAVGVQPQGRRSGLRPPTPGGIERVDVPRSVRHPSQDDIPAVQRPEPREADTEPPPSRSTSTMPAPRR